MTENWQSNKELSSQNLNEQGILDICLTRGPGASFSTLKWWGREMNTQALQSGCPRGPSVHQARALGDPLSAEGWTGGNPFHSPQCQGNACKPTPGVNLTTKESLKCCTFPWICSSSPDIWMAQTPSINEYSLNWSPTEPHNKINKQKTLCESSPEVPSS